MPNQSKTKSPETLADALAEFQKQVKTANREGTAKDRGNRERKYSTLEDLLKALEPALELGLSHSQTFDFLPLENEVLTILVTTLFFKDEKIESKLPLRDPKNPNVMHALGTSITYSRRYALGAIYGIGSEEDDDAMSLNDQSNQKQSSTINRSPQRGANARQAKPSPVAHEMVTGKVAETPKVSFTAAQTKKVQDFMATHPEGWDTLVETFNTEFNKTGGKIATSVTTQEQINFVLDRITAVENLSR
tara:strand:- start:45 stop:788 length:744 start_codon:yes stop_codon:yes gene_type:complete